MNYSYNYNTISTTAAAGIGIGLVVMWLICLAIGVVSIIAMWKVFTKAGKPGWAAIVPVYNIITLLEVVQLPLWYIALFVVPFANIYAMIKIQLELAKVFGKSSSFAVGLILLSPVFLCILGFDKNVTYQVANPVAEQ